MLRAARMLGRACNLPLRSPDSSRVPAPSSKKSSPATTASLTRHLALDPLTEAFELTPDALQARFARHAPALAAEAARRALAERALPAR